MFSPESNQLQYPFTLPNLPYGYEALEPYTSSSALRLHHEKHHAAYVTKLNAILLNMPEMHNMSLEELIIAGAKNGELTSVFQQAGQIWNHSFFWYAMRAAQSENHPSSKFSDLLKKSGFESFEAFTKIFETCAANQFASGWVWAYIDTKGLLQVQNMGNADSPIIYEGKPLFVCDVWEHAYYLDFQNRRLDFVKCFLNHFINWDFVDLMIDRAAA